VSGAFEEANAIQSPDPPGAFVSVAVTELPPVALVALTESDGGGATTNVNADELPPPGAGVKTVTCTVPAAVISAAEIAA
jgi:hypothetical protein